MPLEFALSLNCNCPEIVERRERDVQQTTERDAFSCHFLSLMFAWFLNYPV